MMVLVVIFYAGNILTGKAINELPPFTIAFFRLLIAFVVVFPIGFRSAWNHRSTFMGYKKPFLLMTLTGITFFNTFIYGALQFTTASNVSVLESVIPVMTVILSAFILKERLQSIQWVGVLISFIGAIWVVLNGRIFNLAAIDWNIGDAIMIGAIISWAVYSIYVKQYMHLFPAYAALLVMTGISILVLFPIVLLEWFVKGVPSLGSPHHVIGLLYIGIFPSFIALIFYNRAVHLLSASKAAVFLNFLPVVTMVGAYLWLGETISVMQIIGALVVISGVILTTQGSVKQRKVLDKDLKRKSYIS
jgi:drug/metabolite transporter (DMT)-like permease